MRYDHQCISMQRSRLAVLLLLIVSFTQLWALPARDPIVVEFDTNALKASSVNRIDIPHELAEQPSFMSQLLRYSLAKAMYDRFSTMLNRIFSGQWEEGDKITVDGNPIYPDLPCVTKEECWAKARLEEAEFMKTMAKLSHGVVDNTNEANSGEVVVEGSGTSDDSESGVVTTSDVVLPFHEESHDEDPTPILAIVPPEIVDEKLSVEGSGVEAGEHTVDTNSKIPSKPTKFHASKPTAEEWKQFEKSMPKDVWSLLQNKGDFPLMESSEIVFPVIVKQSENQ